MALHSNIFIIEAKTFLWLSIFYCKRMHSFFIDFINENKAFKGKNNDQKLIFKAFYFKFKKYYAFMNVH